MTSFPEPDTAAERAIRSAGRDAAQWVQHLARVGYSAKGVVYVIIGGLAVHAAVTPYERPEGSEGALVTIAQQPFGQLLLALTAAGLVGYVVWRLVQAILDPEDKGTDAKGVLTRAAYLISGVIYAAIALEAARMLTGSSGGQDQGENRADHWSAVVMSQPMGRWVIAAVGVAVILFGLYEFHRAASDDLRKRLDLTSLSHQARVQVMRFGRFGLAARGVVFLIIGWFLVQAALQYDPQDAQGLAGALGTLKEQPYGAYVLGAVGLGLVAHGLFQLVKARYRVIRAT